MNISSITEWCDLWFESLGTLSLADYFIPEYSLFKEFDLLSLKKVITQSSQVKTTH